MKKHIETLFEVQGNILKVWKGLIGDANIGGEEFNAISKNIEAALDAIEDARDTLIEIEQQSGSRLVAVYYNDVFVSEKPFEIYENCPYVNVPIAEAEAYAAAKLDNGDWQSYCIPELVRDHKVKFL